jgi:hypothetical protein
MTFLPLTSRDELSPEAQALGDRASAANGGQVPNLDATLLGNLPTFTAYLEWFTLKDEVVPWIGERAFTLFAHSISDAGRCLNSSLYFRKALIDSGDDPDSPEVTEAEQLLIDWGGLIVTRPHDIPPEFYDRLEQTFSAERRLTLLAFAGMMVAVNTVITVGKIPLDDELEQYRTR